MKHNVSLERDIEPFLPIDVKIKYWHCSSDHADFRNIVDAIDTGGGQTVNIVGVLKALDKAGYLIVKSKS